MNDFQGLQFSHQDFKFVLQFFFLNKNATIILHQLFYDLMFPFCFKVIKRKKMENMWMKNWLINIIHWSWNHALVNFSAHGMVLRISNLWKGKTETLNTNMKWKLLIVHLRSRAQQSEISLIWIYVQVIFNESDAIFNQLTPNMTIDWFWVYIL